MRFPAKVTACLCFVGGMGLVVSTQALATTSKTEPRSVTMSTPQQGAKISNSPLREVEGPVPVHSVAIMQEALDSEGAHVRIDGVWGPSTEAALRHFQEVHGLHVTGRLDRATRGQLAPIG